MTSVSGKIKIKIESESRNLLTVIDKKREERKGEKAGAADTYTYHRRSWLVRPAPGHGRLILFSVLHKPAHYARIEMSGEPGSSQ